jgi:hypothetical protein
MTVHQPALEALGDHAIEDRLSRVLAYSRRQQHADPARVATIVERQAPKQLRAFFDARGVYTHLTASDEPLFAARDPDHGMTGRMVVAVRSGRELMGSVWVECRAPLQLDDAKKRLAMMIELAATDTD